MQRVHVRLCVYIVRRSTEAAKVALEKSDATLNREKEEAKRKKGGRKNDAFEMTFIKSHSHFFGKTVRNSGQT